MAWLADFGSLSPRAAGKCSNFSFHTLGLQTAYETKMKENRLAGLLRGPGLGSLPGNLCRNYRGQFENVAAPGAQALNPTPQLRPKGCICATDRIIPSVGYTAIGGGTD